MRLYDDFYYLKVNKTGVVDSSSILAVRDDRGLSCIEIGGGGEANIRQTMALLAEDGLDAAAIHTVIITHTHADHMGAIAHFRDLAPHMTVIDHEVDRPYLEDNRLLNGIFDAGIVAARFPGNTFDILAFYRDFCPISETRPDRTVVEGEMLTCGEYAFQVIHTPGHHPGHISLFEPRLGVLFAGDMVGLEVPFYTPSSGGAEGYLASMEKYLALPLQRIIPSHGDLIETPHEVAAAAAGKVMRREERLRDALASGPKTFHELLPQLFRNELQHMFPGAAVLTSHLEKLQREGQVVEEDGRFRPCG
jgi:glyoxylase-like metal-dependent hydrolase (beta-lactamase superfamily II)